MAFPHAADCHAFTHANEDEDASELILEARSIMDAFFSSYPASRQIFNALLEAAETLGPVEIEVMKSQVVLRRKKAFARVWIPEQYLHRKAAPLVLTLSFPARSPSPRWKEIVEPYPGRFTHHLELYDPAEIDDEVITWLRSAWEAES